MGILRKCLICKKLLAHLIKKRNGVFKTIPCNCLICKKLLAQLVFLSKMGNFNLRWAVILLRNKLPSSFSC